MEARPAPQKISLLTYILIGLALLLVAGASWLGYQYYLHQNQIAAHQVAYASLQNELNEVSSQLSFERELASTTIAELRSELAELEDDYRDERNKNDDFEDQLKSLSGTVRDLDKLSKTDEELLQKYSRVYFLNENYVPSDLDKISDEYILAGRKDQYFHGQAMRYLERMIEAAEDDGITLKISSAYRSFDEQSQLKGHFTQTYGSGANAFSADQGYSEHQLGTTADITTPQVAGPYTSFADTDAYKWLLENAHEYGFVLSYPEGNNFYVFEPWHWRFVGEDLAEDLKDADAHFYDWDQRKIDQYLIKIFD